MNCIQKLGGVKSLRNFLISKGYSYKAIQMMISRKKISSKAAIFIINDHKSINFEPQDFYESESKDE